MKICVNRVETYEREQVETAIFHALENLDIDKKIKPGMRVVLKPNLLLARKPENNATTHPEVIHAVAVWLRNHGIKDILLIDSPGGPYIKSHLHTVYASCGMTKLVDVLELNDNYQWITVPAKNKSFKTKEFNLLEPIVEADYLINLAKLKTHSITKITAGIKNLFGTIPGLQKPEFHLRYPLIPDFSNMLVELAETVSPNLTIIDAIESMEGEGPNAGSTKKTGLIFASEDVFTQDQIAAQFMGLKPEEVDMLRIAQEKGLIAPKDQIELIGTGISSLKTTEKFRLPKTFGGLFLNGAPIFIKAPALAAANLLLKPLPSLKPELCIGCGKCAENCPPHIIKMMDRKPQFLEKRKCISCFCCQEMCPAKAIVVRRRLKK